MTTDNKLSSNFDYSQVDQDAKGKLVHWAAEVGRQNAKVVEAYVERGRIFTEAQAELAKSGRNGLFKNWVETECNVSRSTAYNLINVYEVFGNCPTVGQFRPNVLLTLSKETTPDDAIKAAIKASKKGPVTPDMADALIEKFTVESTPEPEPEMEDEPDDFTPSADEYFSDDSETSEPEEQQAEGHEDAAKETADWKAIKKSAKQYAEYAQRTVDDLNRVRPHENHPFAIKLASQLIEVIDKW